MAKNNVTTSYMIYEGDHTMRMCIVSEAEIEHLMRMRHLKNRVKRVTRKVKYWAKPIWIRLMAFFMSLISLFGIISIKGATLEDGELRFSLLLLLIAGICIFFSSTGTIYESFGLEVKHE